MRNAALVLVALAGCFPSYLGANYAIVYHYAGNDHVSTTDTDKAFEDLEVVRDRAAAVLGCSAVSIVQPYGRAYVAAGCDRRAVFVITSEMLEGQRKLPDHDGTYVVTVEHAVDLAAAPLPGEAGDVDLGHYRRLIAAAARDLACAPDQITPDFVPQGRAPAMPVAEGCGQRASYVADATGLRLLSRVTLDR